MSTIHRKGVIRGGQVVVEPPIDLPDGSEVTILGGDIATMSPDEESDTPDSSRHSPYRLSKLVFMTEDEQSNDPEAIQQWIDDLRGIPPVPEDPNLDVDSETWDEKMRQFNIEAVRRQFEEGPA